MKKYFVFICLFLLYSIVFSQAGLISNHWQTGNQIGDSLNIEISTTFPIIQPISGKCATLIRVDDTILHSNKIIVPQFDTGPLTFPPQGCNRLDTFLYILDSTNLNFIKIIWDVKGVTQQGAPYRNMRLYEDSLFIGSTNIIELDCNNLKIYPNPVREELTVRNINQTNFREIQFWDIKGKLVKELKYESERVDVSDLLSGVYILRLIGDYGTEELKVVKE